MSKLSLKDSKVLKVIDTISSIMGEPPIYKDPLKGTPSKGGV